MKQNNPKNEAQIVYFSHGGGPLPILGDASHQAMIDFMLQLQSQLSKPDAILVISAHWEENTATLLGAHTPPMFYDYYGFPDKAYEIKYPAPGSPHLANRIAKLLQKDNIPARIDPQRGFDHGLFIPLKLMYPQADIPSLQLSLLRDLDSAAHYRVALAVCSPAELPPDPEATTKDTEKGPWSVSAIIQNPPQIPVLADGLFVHSTRPTGSMEFFETDVQLPNINCKKCTLQVVELMAEHGYNNPGGYSYHHCADLEITADPAKPIDNGWPVDR
jgi:hypothetical protein